MAVQSLALQTNVSSLRAQKNLQRTEHTLTTSMGRLSSGLRINMAADDAAGLAVSEKLRSHIRGLSQAARNANDGISMLQTAEGALNEIGDMAIRMRELAVQSANGTLNSTERGYLDQEFDQLKAEITRIAKATKFSGTSLLNGAAASGITFQVGIENTTGVDQIVVSIAGATAGALGLGSSTSVSTVGNAQTAITTLDTAIGSISSRRATIGANQNRLNVTINNLGAMYENLSASNSRIRDADVAQESANFTRGNILMQAGIAVLAQANQLPSMALSLLG